MAVQSPTDTQTPMPRNSADGNTSSPRKHATSVLPDTKIVCPAPPTTFSTRRASSATPSRRASR